MRTRFCLFISLLLAASLLLGIAAQSAVLPRERISLDSDWRFHKGDPAGTDGQLDYAKIKDWVVATGNEFVLNAGVARPARPEGNLGANVPYAQRDFDDRGWRQLNLPHDWGIEGPFDQALPGETGKLPWAGVGWYRKHLSIPASDKGKQIYLDIAGALAYAPVWLNGKFV